MILELVNNKGRKETFLKEEGVYIPVPTLGRMVVMSDGTNPPVRGVAIDIEYHYGTTEIVKVFINLGSG